MKNPVRIVLCLCGAVLVCTYLARTEKNTETPAWRDGYTHARLNGAEWKPYKTRADYRPSCEDAAADTREKALNLLVTAGGDCLDTALAAVNRHAKEDLAAAYLTHFERNHEPIELLRALETAEGFNRALAQEWLGLTTEAIHSWNGVVREGQSGWSSEARQHIERLQRLPDPLSQWSVEKVREALAHRDRNALTRMARDFPTDMAQYFVKSDLSDRVATRLYANALAAVGEHYPEAVADAMDRTRNPAALKEGLAALKAKQFRRAVSLLEQAGNPLSLVARYGVLYDDESVEEADATIPFLRPGYRELSSRIYISRAHLLENDGRYLEAQADYKRALATTRGDPTLTADILSRRSANFTVIGNAEAAFGDAYHAMMLLDRVAETNARHQSYGASAMAAMQLGYPLIALYYQNAAVETIQRAVISASPHALSEAKQHLAIALRARAEIHVALGRADDAEGDLQQAADLSEAVDQEEDRDLLRMRVRDVRGQAFLMEGRPARAAAAFTEVIALAKKQDSSYRAVLHFQRAAARQEAGDRRAGEDIATALQILRSEVRQALIKSPEEASTPLWTPYFSRFRHHYDELIESRIEAHDEEGAFVDAELARAFEPMQILLQSRSMPPGFPPIETVAGLRQAQASIPEDTVILQFLVLPERTYTWIVTREQINVIPQRATKKDIERWAADALKGIASGQRDPFTNAMRSVYGELFRDPLKRVPLSKNRIVIVPDGPMHGLPFNALLGRRDEGYLIERASIAVAGSTSIYLHALFRDSQLAARRRTTSALLVGDPAFDTPLFGPLPHAREEVNELARDDYSGSVVLMGAEATVPRFLSAAKNATIIHFAGHSVANPQAPWQSFLLLARDEQVPGELNAEKLMRELPRLDYTRLVVLGACSTAGGSSVGPQGLAPLVRPFIAANVPAVVGALWNVKDASAKRLLVSLHCHYRHGDDVAVALQKAQLERLRNNDPAFAWAAFQVVGYAASPYPRSPALEDPNIEHLCTQDSFLGPDGLHSQ